MHVAPRVTGTGNDPYDGLMQKQVVITLKNGRDFRGILEQKTFQFVRLLLEAGGTCVLRRDEIVVLQTARVDSPQTRGPHQETEVRGVPT